MTDLTNKARELREQAQKCLDEAIKLENLAAAPRPYHYGQRVIKKGSPNTRIALGQHTCRFGVTEVFGMMTHPSNGDAGWIAWSALKDNCAHPDGAPLGDFEPISPGVMDRALWSSRVGSIRHNLNEALRGAVRGSADERG